MNVPSSVRVRIEHIDGRCKRCLVVSLSLGILFVRAPIGSGRTYRAVLICRVDVGCGKITLGLIWVPGSVDPFSGLLIFDQPDVVGVGGPCL